MARSSLSLNKQRKMFQIGGSNLGRVWMFRGKCVFARESIAGIYVLTDIVQLSIYGS